ncbi:Aminopeptidase [Mycena chlorophos]|uniref:Aminopeptidase n=1 Tax=Mycena chlorophos TaxID=658473 RepID=A0A8H6WPZ3_MYCCL|nr:Aminopeptidase [Mycena chlorophos]
MADSARYRLPTNVSPRHYDVAFYTDIDPKSESRFGGFVNVEVDVNEATSVVELNSSQLTLGDATISSGGETQQQSAQSVDTEQQRVQFTFPKALAAGSKAILSVPFEGILRNSMTGYYLSTWEDAGEKKQYSLTQFEATDARTAFPCWDEPLLKATFGITMISHRDSVNLSNMPAISESNYEPGTEASQTPQMAKLLSSLPSGHEWKITKFENTPKMSTYIVAWANGPFVHLEKSVSLPLSKKTIPLRIYTTKDVIHQAQFALDVAERVLPLYEEVFEVEFPLPKLDTLVAADFDAGAMENFGSLLSSFTSQALTLFLGLITGRTSAFLLDPKHADIKGKKLVAMVQSHEVAHMWFGNLTTMKWWDNLYLNEGFATLMGEVIMLGEIFPEWKARSEFISAHLQAALYLDAKLSSHPIEVECPDASHISQIFDSLSYSKAASVLNMLCDYVGEDKFLKGVSLYLKKHNLSNAVTEDLFEGISKASGVDVVRLMDHWIKRQGFPVITVSEGPNGIKVRQDRFTEAGIAEPKENETIWNVPLMILSTDAEGKARIDKTAVLEEREMEFAIDTSRDFKLNANTVGVYRVLYSPERLAKIAAAAGKDGSVFKLEDRMGLLYDIMAFSRAGLAQPSGLLTVISALGANEKEYLMWSSIAEALGGLMTTFWESPDIVESLRAFTRTLFVPLVDRLGYVYKDDEPNDVTQLRTLAISSSLMGQDQGQVTSPIPADLQSSLFIAAVKYGSEKEYDAVVSIQENPKTPTARIAAITAMARTEDAVLLEKTFSYIMKKSRDQDVLYFFRGLQGNPFARRKIPEFFKTNYDEFEKRFEGNFTVRLLIPSIFNGLTTQDDLAATEAFFKDKDVSKYNMALAQALEGIRTRIAYIARSREDVKAWLVEREKQSK